MKGIYALIIRVPHDLEIQIGALGAQNFNSGFWIYIGSAQGNTSTNLEHRLRRHHRYDKKIHWHIDYLLASEVELTQAIWSETAENQRY